MMKKLFSVILMAFFIATLLPACDKDKEKPMPVPDPEISFTASKDAGSSPVRVDFSNTTTNDDNVSWSWEFGDDSTSTEKSPKHYYYAPGTYSVKLTAARNGKTFPALTKTIAVEADPALVAWYKLDGAENDRDASGNENPIELANEFTSSGIYGHKGIINTAVDLSGINSFLFPPQNLIKDQTTDASAVAHTTISMWIYPTDLTNVHGLFSMYDNNAYVPVLFTYNNQLRGMFWDNPEATFVPMSSASKTLTLNKWHHIALAGNQHGQSLYLDGEKVASRDKAISHLQMDKNVLGYVYVRSGGRWLLPEQEIVSADNFHLKGRLDDVRIYHKRLSDDEIRALSKE